MHTQTNIFSQKPIGVMLISILHIVASATILAFFLLIIVQDPYFFEDVVFLTTSGVVSLIAVCLLISSYGLWKLKIWGRRFVIGIHIISIPASTQGLGILGFVEVILIIINDGKITNPSLYNYNSVISAIISVLIIVYLSQKSIRERFS